MTDNRGEELEPGQVVAYNLSGEIAKGRILDLKEDEKKSRGGTWSYTKYKIKIELLHSAGGHPAGHISTVTGPKSVLVLRRPDA